MGWVNAHPVMGTTKDSSRYIKALLTPYFGAITVRAIDRMNGEVLDLLPMCGSSCLSPNPKPSTLLSTP